MSNAIHGIGTKLKIGDGATPTENFTTVTEVASIGGPNLEQEIIDVSNHDTPGGWREKIGGLLNAGQVTFTINYNPVDPTHDAGTGLISDLVNRIKRNFELVFPDAGATKWSFTALVAAFSASEPIDDKVSADITLELTGQPTLA
jgi:predicted secreted protein